MVQRVLIGKFPDGGYGIRVSKPGYDVMSNPVDNKQLAFSSDWAAALPIHEKGSFSLPKQAYQTAIAQRATFTSLGYVPFGRFFIQAPAVTNVVSGSAGTALVTIPAGYSELRGSQYIPSQAVQRSDSTATAGTAHTQTYVRVAIRDGSIWAVYNGTGTDPASVTVTWFVYKLRAK